MYSLIISFVAGFAGSFALFKAFPGHYVWNTLGGLFAFLLVLIVINLILRKKLEAAFGTVQKHIMDSQAILMRKVKSFGTRMTPRIQQDIEREQAQAIREAIDMLVVLKPFEKWNVTVRKQEDTMRAQFYYQIKEFEEADKYFKNALLMDPMLFAMQMARYYKLGDDKALEKCFLKGVSRFKDDKAVILYGTYSWILVQQNKIDKAIEILVDAKTKAENDVLKQNWDNLVNGRIKRFSNAGLGDAWWSLYLEAPRMQRVQQAPGGFGRRHF